MERTMTDDITPEMAAIIRESAQAELDDLERRYRLGLYAIKTADGKTVPAHPQACPVFSRMAPHGVEPVCEDLANQENGCEEFLGSPKEGFGMCRCLKADHPKQEPYVALVALQKREKMPPPLLN